MRAFAGGMGMISSWRSKVFYKYLLSYLLIFSFPLVVLGILIYNNAVVNLQSEIKESNLNKLQFIKESLDLQIKGLSSTATKISFDPILTPFAVRNNSYGSKEAITRLSTYKDNSTIIDDIMLYFRGDEKIYTANGLHSLSTLTSSIYRFHSGQAAEFATEINTITKPMVRPAEKVNMTNNDSHQALSYLFPIPSHMLNPMGTVIFLIRESMLTSPIEQLMGRYDGSIFVLDDNKRVLASKSRGMPAAVQDLEPFLQSQRDTGVYEIVVKGKPYSLASVTSDDTGWTFSMIMPSDQFLERVFEIKTLIFYIFMLIVLTGLGLSAFLSLKSYRPIRELNDFVGSLWTGPVETNSKNELEKIRTMIHATFNRNHNLLGQIDEQRPLVRRLVLHQLLKESLKSEEDWSRQLAAANIKFVAGGFFYVVIMYPDSNDHDNHNNNHRNIGHETTSSVFEHEAFKRLLEGCSYKGQIGYGVDFVHDNTIALIVSTGKEPENAKLRQQEMAFYLQQWCKDSGFAPPTLAIGKSCTDIQHINRSFIEALAAMEYRINAGRGSVLYFDELYVFEEKNRWYSTEYQVKFVHGMKQGNKSVALEALDNILNEIRAREQPIHLLKCSCFDVINTVLKTMDEMDIAHDSEMIRKLVEYRTLDQLQELMRELIRELCDRIEHSKESKNTALKTALIAYIDNRYCRHDFGLESMAETHHLSAAYVSRFFKDQTGINFTEYVSQLRMERIKSLLAHSDLPIKDIVVQSGYMDVPNFMRKFKKLEGLTLGEYRRLQGSKANSIDMESPS
jgi:two-component system response regulator YesN